VASGRGPLAGVRLNCENEHVTLSQRFIFVVQLAPGLEEPAKDGSTSSTSRFKPELLVNTSMPW